MRKRAVSSKEGAGRPARSTASGLGQQSRATAERSAGGGQGGNWGRYLGRYTAQGGWRNIPAQPSPRAPALPSPPSPGYLRARLCTQALPGGVHFMCRAPRSPGWAGGSLGLRGGLPSPPPLPGGAGAPRAGWEAPGAAAAPRPSRRSGCGPGRGSARPPGLAAGLSLPAGPRGWGRQAGGCGPGWRRGLAGRCFRGSRTPPPAHPLPARPPPPRVPRFLPAPVAMTTPLPGLCALGPGVFFPLSLCLLFFSLLSPRVLLAGWREETERVLASSGELTSPGAGEGHGRREGSDVKGGKKKVFSGASGNKG